MLAYILWHYPLGTVSTAEYEERLKAFHGSLAEHPPVDFFSSAVFAVAGTAPWLTAACNYEDWYLVADFAALGILNEAAVSAARKAAHDAAARYADGGAAGVYKLVAGAGDLRVSRRATWLKKPSGMAYPAFFEQLAPLVERAGASLWQRQMTLGPATEFCVHSSGDWDVPGEFAPVALDLRPAA